MWQIGLVLAFASSVVGHDDSYERSGHNIEEAEGIDESFRRGYTFDSIITSHGSDKCTVSGDMYYLRSGYNCYVCACFKNVFGLYAKCASCLQCSNDSLQPSQSWLSVPVPSPREKIYIRFPDSYVPQSVPVPSSQNYVIPVPASTRDVSLSSLPIRVPIPVAPSSTVSVPYSVNQYLPASSRDLLLTVPVPYTKTQTYPVSMIIFVEPICRGKIPLSPFKILGDSCHIHVCTVKYNFVYVESYRVPGCTRGIKISESIPISENIRGYSDAAANVFTGGLDTSMAHSDAIATAASGGIGGLLGSYGRTPSASVDVTANAEANGLGGWPDYSESPGYADGLARAATSVLGGWPRLAGSSVQADIHASASQGLSGWPLFGESSAQADASSNAAATGGWLSLGGTSAQTDGLGNAASGGYSGWPSLGGSSAQVNAPVNANNAGGNFGGFSDAASALAQATGGSNQGTGAFGGLSNALAQAQAQTNVLAGWKPFGKRASEDEE